MTRKKLWVIALVVLLLMAIGTVYFIFFANATHVYNGTLVRSNYTRIL